MADELPLIRARSLSEAIAHLSARGAHLVAGGTDLAGSMHVDRRQPAKVVDITDIDELRGFTPTPDGGLRIGALSTLDEVAAHEGVKATYPAIAKAAQAAGPPELRGRATLGGNLCQRPRCWYLRGDAVCVRKGGDLCFAVDGENRYHGILGATHCHMVHPSDMAPALVAFDARARIVGPDGMRVVPLEDFFLPPGLDPRRENVLGQAEVLTDVLLPPAPAGWTSSYLRANEPSTDYALASVASTMLMLEGRVAQVSVILGAAGPTPWRSREAESGLVGRAPTPALIREAADAALAEAAPLADNRYKVGLFRDLLVDALEAVSGITPGA
jgi:xanthine dehydrogenase YagS FAD-binding subunit